MGHAFKRLHQNWDSIVNINELKFAYFASGALKCIILLKCFLINKWRSLDCALFCCKARRKRLKREIRLGRNTRNSRVFLPTSWAVTSWAVIDVAFSLNTSERISEQALVVDSKGDWCNLWGFLHCDERRSRWWVSRDGPWHDRSHSDSSWLVWILTVMPVFFFFFEHENTCYTSVRFVLPYISL